MRNNNFTTGDEIVCVNNVGFSRLEVGKIYIVAAVYGDKDNIILENTEGSPLARRFRRADYSDLHPYAPLYEDAIEGQDIYDKLGDRIIWR